MDAGRVNGDRGHESWTVHCPDCQATVGVVGSPSRVSCEQCDSVFEPVGLPTTISAPATNLTPDPNVGARLGPWLIVRLIGRGGMGTVYEAREPAGTRRVALKVLRDDLASDSGFVKRFHRESKLLSGLSHPHIVEVLDKGEDNGQLWFAMEYVRGESLRQRMARPIPHTEATQIAKQMASALVYAHAQGVVHRDLKPENVLIDENGLVRLVDFGLSKLLDEGSHGATTHLTRTDVIMGTYEYMAPEQRRGDRRVDGRADLFSLGVILYEMLTGNLPLGRFALPSESEVALPRAYDIVVTKALAMRATDRYANAQALRSDLDAAASAAAQTGPAVRSTPPPLPASRAAMAKAHRHIDIISALDRVGGIVMLLAALGGLPILVFTVPVSVPFALPFSLVGIFAGIWLMKQGSRLSRLEPGSRESQVTASILMLFFPPILTAIGLYGLIAMTSDNARRAIPSDKPKRGPFKRRHGVQIEAQAWAAPTPARVNETYAPSHDSVIARPMDSEPRSVMRRAPTLMLRAFLLITILWMINGALILLDVSAFKRNMTDIDFDSVEGLFMTSVIVAIVASLVFIYQFMIRKKREGLLLAFFALILSCTALGLLGSAWSEHPHRPNRFMGHDPRPPSRHLISPEAPSRSRLRGPQGR